MQRRRKTDVEPPGAQRADDALLLARIALGDRDAFESLYRCYFPRLTRFLGRMTRNAQAIEEIVNDTMLVVWQKAQTFNLSCAVSTWIFAIAYRKALKALRAADEAVEADFERSEGDPALEPEHEAMQQQLQRDVGAALGTLPVEQRMVVCLTYYHGMDYAEIADIMECPANTVKTRMFHARRRLKRMLSGQAERA
jgi:RNA polymerase sigma factor (sigma-70 family)